MKIQQKCQGLALITVLVIAMVLISFAVYFLTSIKKELANVEMFYNQSIAEQLAEDTKAEITFLLYSQNFTPEGQPGWNHWGKSFEFKENIQVSITDLSSSLSIVPFHYDEWRHFLTHKGIEKDRIEAILGEMKDWQDSDNFRNIYGKEALNYEAENKLAVPRNDFMQNIYEFRELFSMDDELFNMLKGHFVYYGSSNRGVKYLPEPLVHYYLQEDTATELLELRNNGEIDSVARFRFEGSLIRGSSETLMPFFSTNFIIKIEVEYANSKAYKSFIVAMTDSENRPFFNASAE